MKNKPIIFSIFIFFLLIGISSFSWAYDTISISSNEYDMSNYDKTTFYDFAISKVKPYYSDVETQKYFLYHRNENNFTAIYFFDDYYFNVYYGNIYTLVTLNNVPHTSFVQYSSDGTWDGQANWQYNFPLARLNVETKEFITNWSDTVLLSEVAFNFDMILKNYNGELISNSNVSSDGLVFGSNEYPVYPDEEEGGTDDTGIIDFITNFWSNLLHIVVPTDEQWQEVQDDWENDVLGKFNIQSWSYNEEDYNYSNSWEWQDGDAPKIPITILGANTTIDMQSFNVWLNTPFSFGQKKLYYSGGGSEMITTIDSGGLTIRKLINILLAIDLFVLNIYLYNKFFSKGD